MVIDVDKFEAEMLRFNFKGSIHYSLFLKQKQTAAAPQFKPSLEKKKNAQGSKAKKIPLFHLIFF